MAYRLLFLTGIGSILIGQVILSKGNDFVYSQQPVDFAHWFLLLGVVFMIPQVFSFPKKVFSYIGIPLTVVGISCVIGMCVLDFIFWSFPHDEMRIEFINHISQVPSIWKPFMTIGPSSKVFNLGLLILSLNYFRKEKVGISILLIASLILWHIIPVTPRLVFGYALTLVGFTMILFRQDIHNKLYRLAPENK